MHTPGPWTHDPEVTDPDTLNTAPEVSAKLPNGDTRYICRMFGTAPQVIEESQANARLIAAAPELLTTLQDILLDIAANESNGLTVKSANRWASVERARAAIANATT